MIKLLGAVLIFTAGCMIGFHRASQYAKRPKQIRQLRQALQRLETEIGYGQTQLPDAFEQLSSMTAEPVAALFRQAAQHLRSPGGMTAMESWQQAAAECWPHTAMGASEKQVVHQLGHTIGMSDRDDQIKHLRLAMAQLQAEEELAREDQRRYEKMWKSLGALSGALIVILMY